MAKVAEKTPQVKGRQTKLSKKSTEELIEIILRKDKTENNLNNQIKSLKSESNSISAKLQNCKADMDGTMETIESYKSNLKVLNERNDALAIEAKDNHNLYEEEYKKVMKLKQKIEIHKIIIYVISIFALIFAML